MFRMWGKLIKDNHLLKDCVAADGSQLNRTKKVYAALEEICCNFDIQVPIWFDCNISDFKRISKTRFSRSSFIEDVDFDYLEISIIEEDL